MKLSNLIALENVSAKGNVASTGSEEKNLFKPFNHRELRDFTLNGLPPKKVLFVGDSIDDSEFSLSLGMRCVLVPFGKTLRAALKKEARKNALIVFGEDLREVLKQVEKHAVQRVVFDVDGVILDVYAENGVFYQSLVFAASELGFKPIDHRSFMKVVNLPGVSTSFNYMAPLAVAIGAGRVSLEEAEAKEKALSGQGLTPQEAAVKTLEWLDLPFEKKAVELFRKKQFSLPVKLTPFASECLQALKQKGLQMAVVSNKSTKSIKAVWDKECA